MSCLGQQMFLHESEAVAAKRLASNKNHPHFELLDHFLLSPII